jgi:hypothetical protein
MKTKDEYSEKSGVRTERVERNFGQNEQLNNLKYKLFIFNSLMTA